MKRKICGSTTILMLLLVSLHTHAQENDRALMDAEFEVELQQMEHRIAELGVEEGELELEKIKLELKQTALHTEMRRIQTQMQRLQIERSQSRLKQIRENEGRGGQPGRRQAGPRRPRPAEAGRQRPDQPPPFIRELNKRIDRLERAVRELAPSDDE